jgi:hypothetical protein
VTQLFHRIRDTLRTDLDIAASRNGNAVCMEELSTQIRALSSPRLDSISKKEPTMTVLGLFWSNVLSSTSAIARA